MRNVVILIAGGWCRAVDDKGESNRCFARERTEVRKVIWPTRRGYAPR